jgi:glutamate dehydrogenase/leucine dehydrogenase
MVKSCPFKKFGGHMEQLLRKWDGEEVIIRFDNLTGAWIIIAIHNTRLGIATGGTRMKPYQTLQDALQDAMKLSEGMSYKYAVSNFARGGAKAVIALPDNFESTKRSDLLRRYGKLIHQLGGLFETGPDVGTSPDDMDIISETGDPYIFCRTPQKGGAGDSGPATALGVFSGMQAVCEQLFNDPSLDAKRVLVQGTGSVGYPLIQLLLEAGAEVLFSEIDEAAIKQLHNKNRLTFVHPDEIFDTPCDIFAPCALGGILNKDTIPRLKCLAVAGGANNQLAEPADAERLSGRQILYAPDYAINIGGAMAIIGMETMGWSQAEADHHVASVRQTLKHIFAIAKAEGINTDVAARRIARSRLFGKG